jgi:HAD superfamily hydrolase (TIGR01549 family)
MPTRPPSPFVSYDAVLFDHDGVLLTLTGQPLHLRGARAAFERVGVTDPAPADVEALSIGVTAPLLEETCERYGVDPEAFWAARDEVTSRLQREAMDRGEKRPYDDIDALSGLSGPFGVVSSNQLATVEHAIDRFDLPAFRTVQAREPTVESLRRKKPEPYYLERALAELGTDTALFVGDSESDIEAARRAGIKAAFVRREHNAARTLSTTPDYEIDGLDGLAALVGG